VDEFKPLPAGRAAAATRARYTPALGSTLNPPRRPRRSSRGAPLDVAAQVDIESKH
jgi:hypothetical protein